MLARDALVVAFAADPGLTRAWNAAVRALETGAALGGVSGWFKLLAASVFAVALNPDDPAGYRGLARLTPRMFAGLARRLGSAAEARELVIGQSPTAAAEAERVPDRRRPSS